MQAALNAAKMTRMRRHDAHTHATQPSQQALKNANTAKTTYQSLYAWRTRRKQPSVC